MKQIPSECARTPFTKTSFTLTKLFLDYTDLIAYAGTIVQIKKERFIKKEKEFDYKR